MKQPTPKVYVIVFVALMVLLALTASAARLDLGVAGTPVGVGIAALKALLIAIFFMHLGYSRGAVRLAAVGGLFWLGLLFALSLNDYLTRGFLGIVGK